MTHSVLVILASLPFMSFSFRSSAEFSVSATQGSVQVPLLPSVAAAHDYCPSSAAGTLVVKCVSAEGLDKKDWFSKSDPYCSVLLSDSHEEESRGLTGKKKAAAKSERMRTKTLDDTHEPEWEEAFGFNIVCPDLPKSYQLEVILKHDQMLHDPTLGRVVLPLQDVMQSSGKDQTFELQDGSGTVVLSSHWCALGDSSCIGTLTEDALVDCGQSCHKALRKAMYAEVKQISSLLSSVESAARMEEMADFMEDLHDDAGDAAENRHGHEARADEEFHDDQEDLWDDIGDGFEDSVKKHWKQARAQVHKLPEAMSTAARSVCHHSLSTAAMVAASPARIAKKYKKHELKSAEQSLKQVENNADSIFKQIVQQLREGNMMPHSNKALDQSCRDYFAR